MVAMSLPSFDYSGLSFIVHQFDRHHGLLPSQKVQKGRAVVMHQLQRHFNDNGLPIEIINIIFQFHLNDTRSASDFLVFYRGSPATHNKSPLLLYQIHYLNSAAENLLKQLNHEVPQRDAYPCLMVRVLTHYFNTLSVDQKIAFIRSSQITVWENRSLTEKIQLLGRARMTSLGDSLKLLSWKAQFAIIKLLEKRFPSFLLLASGAAFLLPWVVIAFAPMLGLGKAAFIQKLSSIWNRAILYNTVFLAGCLALSLLTAALGRIARSSWLLSQSTRDKGAWIQDVSLCCVKIEFHSLLLLGPLLIGKGHNDTHSFKKARDACAELTQLLSQSINGANLNFNQDAFFKAYLPELNQRWLQIAQ
ncbi:MAG TPA: hypothetical protein VHK67_07935 [Rhabdochlamydiaceae bacterium]|jgi:hypothetical protein|nr:hypothetical protein [Rhabdochlamydiaceae bacterium]